MLDPAELFDISYITISNQRLRDIKIIHYINRIDITSGVFKVKYPIYNIIDLNWIGIMEKSTILILVDKLPNYFNNIPTHTYKNNFGYDEYHEMKIVSKSIKKNGVSFEWVCIRCVIYDGSWISSCF